ncbi:MAG: FAD:protein FMN transferase [Candidatus Omnitrophica bacterium]|nr:FAD:protein FMN transferase [Candidatus Omnitrophota bacterium]
MRGPARNRRAFFQSGMDPFWNRISGAMDLKEPLAFLGFDRSYVKLRREAMATDVEVLYCNYEKMEMRRAASKVLSEIDYYDSLLNIWKGESEFKKLNQQAAKAPVQVREEIFALVKLAKEYHAKTGGAFDITATPLVRCWGFFQREGRVPSREKIDQALSCVGMDYVELDEEKRTIYFRKEGVELTPASLGKGYALDRAMEAAHENKLKTVLINGGFSSVLASGAPKWRDSWQIDVRNPYNHEAPLAHVRLRNQGFSSSGSELQQFEYEGKTYGHIIDPRTGWPAGHMVNVNVIAPTAAEAEALSTAFYVMGVEKTLKYCENHRDIGVLMLCSPDEKGRAEVKTANLNQDGVEVLIPSCQTRRVT